MRSLFMMLRILAALSVAALWVHASNSALAASPQGATPASRPLPRSWRDLRLGMTPAQFGRVCKKFHLGGVVEDRHGAEDLFPRSGSGLAADSDAMRYWSEMPLFEHCRSGCKNLKVYACQKSGRGLLPPQAVFLHGHAIAISVDTSDVERCTATNVAACLSNQAAAILAKQKDLYGPPDTTGVWRDTAFEWYVWRDSHTQFSFRTDTQEIELDDLDAVSELTASPEKPEASTEERAQPSKSSHASELLIGNEGDLSKSVECAVSWDAFDKAVKASVANDRMGLASLIAAEQIFMLPAGTRVLAIDIHTRFLIPLGIQVRVLSGDHIGDTCWIGTPAPGITNCQGKACS